MQQSAGRYISLSAFLLVFICFLLPFVRITCSGQEVLTLSGYELAFGATKSFSTGWNSRTEKSPVFVSALMCLLAALLGLVFSLLTIKSAPVVRLIAAGIGLILLLVIQMELRSRLLGRAADMGETLTVKVGTGWILAALAFAAGIIVNILALVSSPGVPAMAAGLPAGRFCAQCGQSLSADDRFCPACGTQRE